MLPIILSIILLDEVMGIIQNFLKLTFRDCVYVFYSFLLVLAFNNANLYNGIQNNLNKFIVSFVLWSILIEVNRYLMYDIFLFICTMWLLRVNWLFITPPRYLYC